MHRHQSVKLEQVLPLLLVTFSGTVALSRLFWFAEFGSLRYSSASASPLLPFITLTRPSRSLFPSCFLRPDTVHAVLTLWEVLPRRVWDWKISFPQTAFSVSKVQVLALLIRVFRTLLVVRLKKYLVSVSSMPLHRRYWISSSPLVHWSFIIGTCMILRNVAWLMKSFRSFVKQIWIQTYPKLGLEQLWAANRFVSFFLFSEQRRSLIWVQYIDWRAKMSGSAATCRVRGSQKSAFVIALYICSDL